MDNKEIKITKEEENLIILIREVLQYGEMTIRIRDGKPYQVIRAIKSFALGEKVDIKNLMD